MKKKLIVLSGFALSAMPALAFAQISTTGSATQTCALTATDGTLFGLMCQIGKLFNAAVPVLIALGVLFFIWGVITYVVASDEEAKSTGRDRIIYGVVGLAVIIGVWGLVNLVRRTFGLNNQQQIQIPTLPTSIDNFNQ